MSFSICLLLVSLGCASSERCSQALHETFRKGLMNFTDGCTDCVTVLPGITSEGRKWSGFCSGKNFFLFEDWKCRKENDVINKTDYFVLGANELCEFVQEDHALNEECLKKFNEETCSQVLGYGDVEGVDGVRFYNTSITSAIKPCSVSPSSTSTHTSWVPYDCELNEFYFNDHCYFFKSCSYYKMKLHSKLRSHFGSFQDVTQCCRNQNSMALGLAVETVEENESILKKIKEHFHNNNNITVLTSGVRWKSSRPDEWKDWNLEIDPGIINVKQIETFVPQEEETTATFQQYFIHSGLSYWFLHSQSKSDSVVTLCERPYNPKNTPLELHKTCLELFRKSKCYSPEKQYYCCGKDDKGEIWFVCPGDTEKKSYSSGVKCSWECKKEGFFAKDRPTCEGNHLCVGFYGGIKYTSPTTRYAISGCPKHHTGFSTWYCSSNGTFLHSPDFSLCCEGTVRGAVCKDTDRFLNVWMGCPSKKAFKKLPCPPGSFKKEALIEWYCDETGNFSGSLPNYSGCNVSACVEVDRFNREWQAPVGTTEEKNCPEAFEGKCYWRCNENGKFDGPEPDCSNCKAAWMETIEDKIKNNTKHEDVMEIMENYTNTEDLRVGYGYILNLTSDCVTLFKKQAAKDEIDVFDKFLKSYSKIFKNVAANSTFWSSFSLTSREKYGRQILKTTQNASFAVLDSKNSPHQRYNATLANSKSEGFDFFVAYGPLKGSTFPLEGFSESDWHLDVVKINESSHTQAAMGLVMSYTLSSLMFPSGIKKEDFAINAPAVTFTVAESVDGEVFFNPNVVVSISFKHTNRTRYPERQIIKRRLHPGEQPSGVFKSTVCCYYSNGNWSTEGCWVTFSSKDRTNCTCSHLSTIGLLMSIHKYIPDPTLEFVSAVSSGITVVSLILALLVFYFLDTLKNERVLIGKNLCFCLLLGHIMLLTVLDKKFFNISDNLCTASAILLHFVFMAAFSWMFVEGCHLYRMLVFVFDSGFDYRRMYLWIGYGVPFIVVGMTIFIGFLFKEQPYGQDEFCWLKPPNYVWAFVGPVIVTTSINLCILVTATRLAISSRRRLEKSNNCTIRLWLKGWISLSTLLGITWFLGLGYILYNENLAYTFVLFNGLQGFFIFIFRCLLCEQYKNVFIKKIKSLFFGSKSTEPKRSDTVKSETKLYAISGAKSLLAEIDARDSGYDPGIEKLDCCIAVNKAEKSTRKTGNCSAETSSAVNTNFNIILTPEMSEAYLRNRMIAKNFCNKKPSRQDVSDNFPELSYHNIRHPN